MNIGFKSLTRPRRAAKAMCEQIPGLKLTEAQAAVARMCGYAGWEELKLASESSDTQASPDDEELTDADLQARLTFQAQQIRAIFKNTLPLAREIVRLTSPTARSPAAPPSEPPTRRPQLRGAAVYMPSLLTRFSPSYPEVFGFLYDVTNLRIEFIQPEGRSGTGEHLASSLAFTFANGRKLVLDGVYFWKFLDSMPSELLDADGDFLHPNPFAKDSVEAMLMRLRIAYQSLFSTKPGAHLKESAPLWVELDLNAGSLIRKNAICLQETTKNEFFKVFSSVCEASSEQLQPVVDKFMVECLNAPRVELQLVNRGGRGSGVFGNEYVRSSWGGTGHWTMNDLFLELSPVQLHPSGCGGNLSYRELFERTVEPLFQAAMLETCLVLQKTPALYSAVHAQLELPALKGRKSSKAAAKQLVEGLLATSIHLDLEFSFSQTLLRRQGERTFSSWIPELTEDPNRTRPTVRLDEMLKSPRLSLSTQKAPL